jgi:RNA polymerase sigma factor (sigma-70 family)
MIYGSAAEKAAHWVDLVQKINRGDARAAEEFYATLSHAVLPGLAHVVDPQSIEDVLHEVLVIVLQAILRGGLRDARCLMGFVKRVARCQAVVHIRHVAFRRQRFDSDPPELLAPAYDSPDVRLDRNERSEHARNVLRRLSVRDREILQRFYFDEQPRQQICGEMHLSDTQFRLFKSRAIARCSKIAALSLPARSESRIV